MFARTQKNEAEKLTPVIDKLLVELDTYSPDSPEFNDAFKKLKKLYALRSKDKQRIDPNTLLTGAFHILGIVAIVAYEQKHVFTSKGLGFVPKLK